MVRRRTSSLLAWAAVVALLLVACSQAVDPDSVLLDSQAAHDRYIVVLEEAADGARPGRGRARAAEVARAYGLQPSHTYGAGIVGFAAQIPAGRVAALRQDPRVRYVETDDPVHIFDQAPPTGVERIFASTNAGLDIDGSDDLRVDVGVAVLDTGIDLDHPDLNVAGGVTCTLSGGGPPWSRSASCAEGGDDDHYHGTHVAGTIAALDNDLGVVGVAPGARLYAVKVLDSSGSGYESMIVAGIDWVTARVKDPNEATRLDISVANMSLGGSGFSRAEYDAIEAAVEAGVAFAVAAGNSDADAGGYSPAAFDNVLTVSALADFDGIPGGLESPTCRDDQDDTLADFSNWGNAVDIAAPGVCILSTYPVGQGSYGMISGTSMASPHAAGALALLASSSRPENAADVEALYGTVVARGNLDWTDDSGDITKERLLDVSTFSAGFTEVGGDGGGDDGDADADPTVSITSPSDGATVSGSIALSASAGDDHGVASVEFFVDSVSVGVDTDGANGWTIDWDSLGVEDGARSIAALAIDTVGQQASDTILVTVANVEEPQIALSATGYKVKGVQHADLSWSGVASGQVDIYRDGAVVDTVADPGGDVDYTDDIGRRGGGTYAYRVCEAGTTTCSNEASVAF